MKLSVPETVFRATPSGEKKLGRWTTPVANDAIKGGYGGHVTEYGVHSTPRILDMGIPDNVKWVHKKLLEHGFAEAAKTLLQVFRIKEDGHGENFVERDSTYEGDTIVLTALLDLDQRNRLAFDGFGAHELPMTDSPERNFHAEICFFKPEQFLVQTKSWRDEDKDRVRFQNLKRREGQERLSRKKQKTRRGGVRLLNQPSFDDGDEEPDRESDTSPLSTNARRLLF